MYWIKLNRRSGKKHTWAESGGRKLTCGVMGRGIGWRLTMGFSPVGGEAKAGLGGRWAWLASAGPGQRGCGARAWLKRAKGAAGPGAEEAHAGGGRGPRGR